MDPTTTERVLETIIGLDRGEASWGDGETLEKLYVAEVRRVDTRLDPGSLGIRYISMLVIAGFGPRIGRLFVFSDRSTVAQGVEVRSAESTPLFGVDGPRPQSGGQHCFAGGTVTPDSSLRHGSVYCQMSTESVAPRGRFELPCP